MEKMYFLPQWYLENKKSKRKRIIRILISVFIIIDLIIIELLFVNINKNKILEDEYNQKIILEKSESLKKNKTNIKNNRTLDTFLIFTKCVQENISFENLYIEGKRIELDLNSEKLDCMSFVKEIETKNEFTIKQVSALGNGPDSKIKIIMELK